MRICLTWIACCVLLNVTAFSQQTAGTPALPIPETWSETAALDPPRLSHSATLLLDGRVLIAGGALAIEPRQLTATCQIFDPSTGAWSATGDLNVVRERHTAVLLKDGRVLLLGGRDTEFQVLDSAEVYDPAAGTWTSVDSLAEPRLSHAMAALRDGRVLVVGGTQPGSSRESAELFDPATDTWIPTGSLSQGRRNHTATVLPDGRVLVAGGSYFDIVSSVEIYDPQTGAWTPGPDLGVARASHSAVLLSGGRVLVAGGSGEEASASSELYDPSSNSWAATGHLRTPRLRFRMFLLSDGRALAVGGIVNGTLDTTASAELFDPAAGSWSETDSLSAAPWRHRGTLLQDGRVLMTGGRQGDAALGNSEIFNYVQLIYPQLALGGGLQVLFLVTNQSEEVWTGRALLDSGTWPANRNWSLDGQDGTGESGFDIVLQANETRRFLLESSGAAVSGWLEVVSDSPVAHLAPSFFYNFSTGQLEDSTGVGASGRRLNVRFPVERSQNVNTGLAIRRSSQPLSLTLFDENGSVLETVELSLDGARFFDQLFSAVSASFLGSMQIESAAPFYITVIRQEIIPGGTLRFQLTSVPATDGLR